MLSNEKWFGAEAGFYPETIDQSVRFNDDDSPKLFKTFGTPTSNQKMIYSTWFKTTETASHQTFFSGGSDSFNYFLFALSTASFYSNSDMIFFALNTSNVSRLRLFGSTSTGPFFRDSTNWYHILLAIDTTQATNTDRIHVFVNGKKITTWANTTYPSQNYSVPLLNTAIQHNFGFNQQTTYYGSFDGYFAETYFLDGQSIFSDTSGTINSTFLADADTLAMFCEQKNGIAVPKSYSGTFGNNGVKLTYADSSNLGDDTSGNTNDFTSSGLASTDVVLDSPTNNFCTLNPLNANYNVGQATFSEGNLRITSNSANRGFTTGTFKLTGKHYFEVYYKADNSGFIGIQDINNNAGGSTSGQSIHIYDGSVRIDGSSIGSVTTFSVGDVIGVEVDIDAKTIEFFKNGVSVSDNTYTTDAEYFPFIYDSSGGRVMDLIANFGQDASFAGNKTSGSDDASDSNGQGTFYETPSSGFLALCSSNLSDTTLSPNQSEQADDYFNTVLYTGVTGDQSITGVGFQPDLTWIKSRSNAYNHNLLDSSRGGRRWLGSNSPSAEDYNTSAYISSFDSDGFTLDGDGGSTNINTATYASWNWKVNGGTTSSNTDGTITSTVQASTDAGFSILTYTGTGTSTDTVGHGLGAKPKMVIVKSRSEAQNWHVYHEGVDATAPHNYILTLNATNAKSSSSSTFWGGTAPTTTVMGVGSDNSSNKLNTTYVMYLFAEISGFSSINSYTGNSSTDGTFVYTGFRPAWVMIKSTSTGSWCIFDNKINPDNAVNLMLLADSNGNENAGGTGDNLDFLSNGFKLRDTSGGRNTSGTTYIYIAFAEQPFHFSNAR